MAITYVPDLLVTEICGPRVPVEAWIVGELNRNTLFAVTKYPGSALYSVTHVPTGGRLFAAGYDREIAIEACRRVIDLLRNEDAWCSWGSRGVYDIQEWKKRNPDKCDQITAIRIATETPVDDIARR